VHEKMLSLFQKGGYEVVYPEGLSSRWVGGRLGGWVGGRVHLWVGWEGGVILVQQH
jgi:hypothetical protein